MTSEVTEKMTKTKLLRKMLNFTDQQRIPGKFLMHNFHVCIHR